MNPKEELAEKYAKETTTTKCMRMGECDECKIRVCDYRARLNAYKQGWQEAMANRITLLD